MYSTCLFCHAALGQNASIEHFPVGRRLAFDAAKGRLWVVCKRCLRWNLSPLDERWEAIEEAERAYRDTKKRVTTDQVGLARLRDGTDLIRIGEPLRPEFAAWRYGDTFGRRRRNQLALGGVGVAAAGGLVAALTIDVPTFIMALTAVPIFALNAANLRRLVGIAIPRVRVVAGDGAIVKISDSGLSHVLVQLNAAARNSDQELNLGIVRGRSSRPTPMMHITMPDGTRKSFRDPIERLSGRAAELALTKVLAATNAFTGSAKDVFAATQLVENTPSPTALLRSLPLASYTPWLQRMLTAGKGVNGIVRVSAMPAHARLALEMSLHEESERRALQGELHELEQRWKEAEEIAAISDSLFLAPKGTAPSD